MCKGDQMPDDQVDSVAKVFSESLDKIAATMDKHGTSAWIASVGLLLIGFVLVARVSSWGDRLHAGEFIAVLIVGLIFVLIGVSYRLYARIAADAALRGEAKRHAKRAEDLEKDAAVESRTAAEIVEQIEKGAPKS